MRVFHQNKQAIYPYDEWHITETTFDPKHNHRNETIFALGNGYMGMRGTFEENVPEGVSSTPGIYINGIYETEDIIYGEFAPNQPKEYQTMINIMDWKTIYLTIEGEKFSLAAGKVENYQRSLDMKHGTLRRSLTWTSPSGKKIAINISRFISQTQPHLAFISYEIVPLNFSGIVAFESVIDGAVSNLHHLRNKALKTTSRGFKEDLGYLLSQTQRSGFTVGSVMLHELLEEDRRMPCEVKQAVEQDRISVTAEFPAETGTNYRFIKYVGVGTSRESSDVLSFLEQKVTEAALKGYNHYLVEHQQFMENFWDDTDVEIKGDPILQQGFRFNALHLLQATGRDGKTNVAAKGLTGEYYEGHYFWDTETYIIPFFLYSQPELVKQLLLYRYSTLDAARENAKRMRNKGALYAWRTINGHEASGNFLGSTVQYHINADIAYAIHKYLEATEDYQFLADYGAEILFETARCWADRGAFLPSRGGKYCINEVCGPDEYKPGVNNNCYTNYMAKFNLDLALEGAKRLKQDYPEKYQALVERIGLTEDEFELWRRCSENMYLPYNEELGIHPQDDSFLDKDPIDVDSIPEEDIPLVGNWHPLVIWRYQIIKQADVVLLLFLLGDKFTFEQKKANFDYYEPKTTHDSSLSPAIYSIIASEIGYQEYAYNYFMQTARLDLDDYNKNAWQGVHTACMAGSWMCVVNGFAGLRTFGGKLQFNPIVPQQWDGYSFKVKFRGRQVHVRISEDHAYYNLLSGEKLSISHRDQDVTLLPNQVLALPL